MTLASSPIARGALLAALLGVAGCATDPAAGDARQLESSLSAYHTAMRWHPIEQSLALHDPARLEKQPPSAFELERWRQFRVVGYRDSPPVTIAPGRVQQRVTLELMNLNTQSLRSVVDVQEWRYDEASERWWLTSGLPSLDAR